MRVRSRTAAILAVLLLAGAAGAEERCRTSHTLVGEHPSLAHTAWSRDLQGIAHDEDAWFVTNVDGLYRIPAGIDLGRGADAGPDPAGWLRAPIPPDLVARGFDHFGDLSAYRRDGNTYLCVPVENGSPEAVLAFFRGSDLAYTGHASLPGVQYAPLCALDRGGHAVLPTERNVPVFRRYRIDWHGITHGRPGVLEPVGELALHLEDGAPFDEFHMGGAAFSDDGRILYVLTGYLDDHACPIWSARFWTGSCAFDPDVGGIHVFDVRDANGGVCDGAGACTALRVEKSHNAQDRGDGSFLYRYLGSTLRGEEPEGLTVWDLDADGAPEVPGASGQVHALLLDNELPTSADRVSIRHYRASVECPPRPDESRAE